MRAGAHLVQIFEVAADDPPLENPQTFHGVEAGADPVARVGAGPDPRVAVLDRTNARYLERLPEPVDLVTVDVSFISLRLILPAALGWLRGDGCIVALVKPQFEAGRERLGKGGVVRDPAVHRSVLTEITDWAAGQELGLQGLILSPITGPAGNVEFLAWWAPGRPDREERAALINTCLAQRPR